MERDWHDYRRLHGNEEGARAAFEDDCEALLQRQFPAQLVRQVEARPGDEGVDVFIGAIGVEPVDVYQCKFFLTELGNSQKDQIRRSFARAMTSGEYQVKSWVLCLPLMGLSLAENKWWAAWQREQRERYQIPVRLLDGRELIRQFKEAGLYATVFKLDDSLRLAELHEALVRQGQLTELSARVQELGSGTASPAAAEALLTVVEQQLVAGYRPRAAREVLTGMRDHLERHFGHHDALLARYAHLLALACQESGDEAAACSYARQASTLLPHHAGYTAAAAVAWATEGQQHRAELLARQALDRRPDEPQAHAVLAFGQAEGLSAALAAVPPAVARQPVFRETLLVLLREVTFTMATLLLGEDLAHFDPPATLTFANRRYWVIVAEIIVQFEAAEPALQHTPLPAPAPSPALRRAHQVLAQYSEQLRGSEKLLLAGNVVFLRSLAGYYLTGQQQEFNEYATLFPQLSAEQRQRHGAWWAGLLTRWQRPGAEILAVLDAVDVRQDADLLYLRFMQQRELGQEVEAKASLQRSLELTSVVEDTTYTRARLYLLLYCHSTAERVEFVAQCRARGQLTAELPARLLAACAQQPEKADWPATRQLLDECAELAVGESNPQYGLDVAELYHLIGEFAASLATQQRLPLPTEDGLLLLWERLYLRNLYDLGEHSVALLQRLAAWRTTRPAEWQFCRWELELCDYLGDWPRRLEVATHARQACPDQPDVTWHFLYSLHLLGLREQLRPELEALVQQPGRLTRQALFNAAVIARQAGWSALACTLLYPLARDPQDVVARDKFAHLFLLSGEQAPVAPTVAAEGVVVSYRLDNALRPPLLLTPEAVAGSHPVAGRLPGLRVGDHFSVPDQLSGRPRQGTVVELLDAHTALFRDITRQTEEQAGDFNLQALHFDSSSLQELERVLTRQFGAEQQSRRARIEQLLREHGRGEAAFSAVARGLCDDNGLDAYRLLTSAESHGFYVAPLTHYYPLVLTADLTYVLDWSTLPLFYQLHEAGLLALPASLWVSAQVPEFLRELIAEKERLPAVRMSLFIDEYRVRPHFYADNYKADELTFLRQLLAWVLAHCRTRLVVEKLDVLREGGRRESSWLMEDAHGYFGGLIDTVFLADHPNTILISDDEVAAGLLRRNQVVVSSEKYLMTFAPQHYLQQVLPFLLERHYVGLSVSWERLYDLFIQTGGRFAGLSARYLDSVALLMRSPQRGLAPLHWLLRRLYLTGSLSPAHVSLAATTVYLAALRYAVPTPQLELLIERCIARQFELLPLHADRLREDFAAAWRQVGATQLQLLPI